MRQAPPRLCLQNCGNGAELSSLSVSTCERTRPETCVVFALLFFRARAACSSCAGSAVESFAACRVRASATTPSSSACASPPCSAKWCVSPAPAPSPFQPQASGAFFCWSLPLGHALAFYIFASPDFMVVVLDDLYDHLPAEDDPPGSVASDGSPCCPGCYALLHGRVVDVLSPRT